MLRQAQHDMSFKARLPLFFYQWARTFTKVGALQIALASALKTLFLARSGVCHLLVLLRGCSWGKGPTIFGKSKKLTNIGIFSPCGIS